MLSFANGPQVTNAEYGNYGLGTLIRRRDWASVFIHEGTKVKVQVIRKTVIQ